MVNDSICGLLIMLSYTQCFTFIFQRRWTHSTFGYGVCWLLPWLVWLCGFLFGYRLSWHTTPPSTTSTTRWGETIWWLETRESKQRNSVPWTSSLITFVSWILLNKNNTFYARNRFHANKMCLVTMCFSLSMFSYVSVFISSINCDVEHTHTLKLSKNNRHLAWTAASCRAACWTYPMCVAAMAEAGEMGGTLCRMAWKGPDKLKTIDSQGSVYFYWAGQWGRCLLIYVVCKNSLSSFSYAFYDTYNYVLFSNYITKFF